MLYRCSFFILTCITFFHSGFSSVLSARELIGNLNGKVIRVETTMLEGVEYVSAASIIQYFGDGWEFDSLSGTLSLARSDGIRVGMRVGDQRILVGKTIFNMGTSLVRIGGEVHIPLSVVNEHLLPLSPLGDTAQAPEEISSTPTAQQFIFMYPDPSRSTPTPAPTSTPVMPDLTPLPESLPSVVAPFAIIILDPGNDSVNPGATGPNGVRETDLNFAVCEKLAYYLRQSRSYRVLLTRNNKAVAEAIGDDQRAAFANQNNGTIFVSVHCGNMITNTISRAALYYMNDVLDPAVAKAPEFNTSQLIPWQKAYVPHIPESLNLARRMLTQMQRYYEGAGVIQLNSHPLPGRFGVLRGLKMPGVLIELGNLSHPHTAAYLSTDSIQNELANHLALSISSYLVEHASGPVPVVNEFSQTGEAQ